MLPITRLVGAGATPAELEHLEAQHEASSLEEQESVLERLRGIAEGGVRDWLDELRAAGTFGDAPAPHDTPADDDEGDGEAGVDDQVDEPDNADEVKAEAEPAAAKPRAPRKPAKA